LRKAIWNPLIACDNEIIKIISAEICCN